MNAFPVLPYTVDNGIVTLTLNRPDKRNALNQAMVKSLKAFLVRAADDPAATVVVITGRGKDFCAGADLAELEQMTAPEIADSLGVNLNTVYSRLRAARQKFEAALKRHQAREASA